MLRRSRSERGVDLVATALDREILLGSGSIGQGPELPRLHGEHERDGIRFLIAGHRSPVAVRPREGVVSDAFVAAIKGIVSEAL
jgi:hypothetical protein